MLVKRPWGQRLIFDVRNIFLASGLLMIIAGVGFTFFDAPLLYHSSRGGSTPASFVMVALSKPLVLMLGGLGMMLGGIAAAIGCLTVDNPDIKNRSSRGQSA